MGLSECTGYPESWIAVNGGDQPDGKPPIFQRNADGAAGSVEAGMRRLVGLSGAQREAEDDNEDDNENETRPAWV